MYPFQLIITEGHDGSSYGGNQSIEDFQRLDYNTKMRSFFQHASKVDWMVLIRYVDQCIEHVHSRWIMALISCVVLTLVNNKLAEPINVTKKGLMHTPFQYKNFTTNW